MQSHSAATPNAEPAVRKVIDPNAPLDSLTHVVRFGRLHT